MAKLFRHIGSVVLSVLLLISFTGIIIERGLCVPCGTENEEIHLFANLSLDNNHDDCCCNETESISSNTVSCCATETKEHCDITKISYQNFDVDILPVSIKFLAKPFTKVFANFNTNCTTTLKASTFTTYFFNHSLKAPPNQTVLSKLCVFRN